MGPLLFYQRASLTPKPRLGEAGNCFVTWHTGVVESLELALGLSFSASLSGTTRLVQVLGSLGYGSYSAEPFCIWSHGCTPHWRPFPPDFLTFCLLSPVIDLTVSRIESWGSSLHSET